LWLIVYVNASWLESRKLSATQGKKCQHSTGENKIGPSHHSGDDGVNRSHDNVKMFPNAEKCCHLPGAVRASSTVIRKQFHVVAVAMFVPGLLMDVNMLRVAVSCALVVLVMLEVGREAIISLVIVTSQQQQPFHMLLYSSPCLSWHLSYELEDFVGAKFYCQRALADAS